MVFEFSDFSKYRTQLMGLSILLIMLFHTNLLRCGSIGVEFFLIISSIGLYFSLSKDQRLKSFYKKRFIRILPAYLIVAVPYFFYHNRTDFKLSNYISDLLGLYIFNSEFYFWFIGLIIICYLIAPFYFKLLKYRYSILIPFITLVVCFFLGLRFNPLEVMLNRFAIFFLGFHLAQLVHEKKQFKTKSIYFIPFSLFVIFLIYYIGQVPIEQCPSIKRVFNFFLTIPAMMGLIVLLKMCPQFIQQPLAFLGGITLELYMVHERICLKTLSMLINPFAANIISFPVAIIAAYLLHKLISLITPSLQTKQVTKEN